MALGWALNGRPPPIRRRMIGSGLIWRAARSIRPPFRGDVANDALYPLPDALYRRLVKARAIMVLGDGTIYTFSRAVREIDESAAVQDRRKHDRAGGNVHGAGYWNWPTASGRCRARRAL